MKDATFAEIQQGLELLEQKRETDKKANTTYEKTSWELFWENKHINFLKLAFIIGLLILASAFVPIVLVKYFSSMNAYTAENLQSIANGSTKFFSGFLVTSFAIYLLENVFYQYINRNGNNFFDYQENFKELSAWQKIIITTIKKLGYLLYFACCLML